MICGFATSEGTARYGARFRGDFYRKAQEWTVSSLGIGSYLGAPDETTSHRYTEAMLAALEGGINFIDTSLNYRHQRSERAIGEALARTGVAREEYVVCTKAGFLVPDAVPLGVLQANDIAGNMHCMAPAFLTDQLERSRANLGLETIDVFYLHNPETQLGFVSPAVFEQRVRDAFGTLEECAAQGKIRYYGAATWEGFRKPGQLQLSRLEAIAREVGGAAHRFRFAQFPLNLAMLEALTARLDAISGEPAAVTEAAQALGITAVASASLLQAKLLGRFSDELAARFAPLEGDALRAIQFTRSAPGLTVALAGMSRVEHVRENLALAEVAPLTAEAFAALFRKS